MAFQHVVVARWLRNTSVSLSVVTVVFIGCAAAETPLDAGAGSDNI